MLVFGVGSEVLHPRHEAAHVPTVARPISGPLRPEASLNKSIEKEASANASLLKGVHVGVA